MLASSVIILCHQNHSGVDCADVGGLVDCMERLGLGFFCKKNLLHPVIFPL